MLLAWHQMTYRGPWCRDCGTATFRKAQNWNLMLGWWGLASFFLNLYAVLRNLASYNRVRALAAPTGSSRSLQPGRTLVARPGLWIFAVVLVAVLVFVVTRAIH